MRIRVEGSGFWFKCLVLGLRGRAIGKSLVQGSGFNVWGSGFGVEN